MPRPSGDRPYLISVRRSTRPQQLRDRGGGCHRIPQSFADARNIRFTDADANLAAGPQAELLLDYA